MKSKTKRELEIEASLEKVAKLGPSLEIAAAKLPRASERCCFRSCTRLKSRGNLCMHHTVLLNASRKLRGIS